MMDSIQSSSVSLQMTFWLISRIMEILFVCGGSLTARNGSTSVRSEGVQMNIWNDGWANPKSMYQQGYV